MIKKIALCLTALCLTAQAHAFEFIFAYTQGKYISLETGYATVGIFTPYAKRDWLTFVDLRGYRFDDNRWGGSVGLGGRFMLPCYGAVGLNAYYDALEGKWGGNFHQVGGGLEWLNPCWDIRLNGYFPIGRHSHFHKKCFFSDLGGGFMASRGRLEYVYSGVDLEAGMHLFTRGAWDLYGALGPYYYSAHEHKRYFYGAFARLQFSYNDYFYAQIKMSHDRIYHTRVQGTVELKIPLEFFLCLPACGCEWFTKPVYRNGVILTEQCCTWSWNW